ncbi:MAG: UDP-3-O-(3-hydroxymyristoyl)glucosamine N-acyltransferase [Acidobacteria bacterium]|nr:MAG: UDP-3-O-(3-hydroxymyristoyl)glucosamine N-acyltransferase [Acidobacteriota bacterium]PYS13906.1 MAG: UDP-3-O-(3-hydroxymyristoyl)glucosamine N-acyltransferase [Acidobacteriota bacterium]
MKLSDIAARLECVLNGDGDVEITRVVGIDDAGAGHLTFVSNAKYAAKARTTKASAVIVSNEFPEIPVPTLRCSNPYLAFARAVELFYQPPDAVRRINPAAVISPSAKIGEGASIGPYVVIEDNVRIGNNCTIHPFVHICRGVEIGDNFKAYAHVTVRESSVVGNNVILQDGAKIGTDGYGYAKQDDGTYYKIVQSGIVVLEDDVEVGANATIDRATIGETRVRRGAKIDNLVQVGHASDVGEDTLLCAQVGLAGSSKIGRSVILTGQVGVAGHLEIGDRVVATAQTGIPNSIEPDKIVSGYPAIDNKLWLRSSAIFKRLPDLLKRIETLEKRIEDLAKNAPQSAGATSHNKVP